MQIGVQTFRLMLPGVDSLKGKRMVVKSLKSRMRQKFNVSVSETGLQDVHQAAEITVAVVAGDRGGGASGGSGGCAAVGRRRISVSPANTGRCGWRGERGWGELRGAEEGTDPYARGPLGAAHAWTCALELSFGRRVCRRRTGRVSGGTRRSCAKERARRHTAQEVPSMSRQRVLPWQHRGSGLEAPTASGFPHMGEGARARRRRLVVNAPGAENAHA